MLKYLYLFAVACVVGAVTLSTSPATKRGGSSSPAARRALKPVNTVAKPEHTMRKTTQLKRNGARVPALQHQLDSKEEADRVERRKANTLISALGHYRFACNHENNMIQWKPFFANMLLHSYLEAKCPPDGSSGSHRGLSRLTDAEKVERADWIVNRGKPQV